MIYCGTYMISSVRKACEVYFDEEKMTYNAMSVNLPKIPMNNGLLNDNVTRRINSATPIRWEFCWVLPTKTFLTEYLSELTIPVDEDLYEVNETFYGKLVVDYNKIKVIAKANEVVEGEFCGFACGGARIVLKNLEPAGMVEKILARSSIIRSRNYHTDYECSIDGKMYVFQLEKYEPSSNELIYCVYDY